MKTPKLYCLGEWWLHAASKGLVPQLPIVNVKPKTVDPTDMQMNMKKRKGNGVARKTKAPTSYQNEKKYSSRIGVTSLKEMYKRLE